jgi:hypothetical protein
MTNLVWPTLALLGACHVAAPTATAPIVPATASAACSAPRSTDGFALLERSGPIQFVSSPADEPAATQMFTAYASGTKGLERRTPETADRSANLIIFGTYETNALIAALASGPVPFERGKFRFGGHVYDQREDGVAVVMPSPFARDRYVVVYAGNAAPGLEMTLSVPTGDHHFTVVSSPIGVAQEGEFCTDGTWSYYAPYAVDRRADWEAYRATLAHRDTPHHVIYYARGTKAEHDIDAIAKELEDDYAVILEKLAVASLDRPIDTYLWSDRKAKQRFTGDPGNGVAIGNSVHALYLDNLSALGAHEYVHVVASARLGDAPTVWAEGLAVAITGDWNGKSLHEIASGLAAAGKLPRLAQLMCCFRDVDDNITYPVAGDLVAFVIQRYGMAKFKQLYIGADPAAAIQSVLGSDVAALETDWLASLERQ